MRASGDPYLQHCVETAVSLAMIGANATVVAAGLLHDTLDDSFMSHDYIRETFGAGVADLVGGVRIRAFHFLSFVERIAFCHQIMRFMSSFDVLLSSLSIVLTTNVLGV